MGDVVIRTENLGKLYRIGEYRGGYKTLGEKLTNTFSTPFRLLRRNPQMSDVKPQNELIWALKDISFEVKRGQVVGIIGRNGAGKSTLLRVLSRITNPTEGWAEIRGRVGSLLEVGTGFHPELTGRENIYLNGAILGMSKAEINRKFDEIVAFSEIDRFIDTPVKRYSSGMYVRLAFAVAAHLEPEILLVDEVLAVGDAAFQRKCLGKMGDVASEGRTVLFVSHNMGAVRSLCQRSIMLGEGEIALDGASAEVITTYLTSSYGSSNTEGYYIWPDNQRPGGGEAYLCAVRLMGREGEPRGKFEPDEPIKVEVEYELRSLVRGMRVNIQLLTQYGEIVFTSTDHNLRGPEGQIGRFTSTCEIPAGLLNSTLYILKAGAGIPGVKELIPHKEILSFSVEGNTERGSYFPESWPGVVCPRLEWTIRKIDQSMEQDNLMSPSHIGT
jgi:lipopolysaccharide transport system ATP-binding protein